MQKAEGWSQGEPNYVGLGAFDELDRFAEVVLGGVGAGFVEGMDAGVVAADLLEGEWA